MPHPTPTQLALTYEVPAAYINLVAVVYINGLFRLTFIEQNLTPASPGSSEVTEVAVARSAIIMTPAGLAGFLKSGGELFNSISTAMQQGGGAATIVEGSDTLQ